MNWFKSKPRSLRSKPQSTDSMRQVIDGNDFKMIRRNEEADLKMNQNI